MSEPGGGRLIRACETLCDELRRRIGLTAFRIELERPTTPLVISLRGQDVLTSPDQRHDPRVPARIEVVVSDGDRRIATVRIEDAHRAEYPEEARAASHRIVVAYAPELSALLRSAAWIGPPTPFVSTRWSHRLTRFVSRSTVIGGRIPRIPRERGNRIIGAQDPFADPGHLPARARQRTL